MSTEQIKYKLIDNIMSYLRYQFLSEVEEHNNRLPIFNKVYGLMKVMNKQYYSYTLQDIDDKLFDRLIKEVIKVLG